MDASQLSEISLIDPTFKGTVFQGSLNFSGAVITPFHLDYCDFSRASITDEPFSISIKLPSEWNADSLDRELNHFNNRASSSLLEKLHKLPDSLSLTKLSGFIQIIESLEDVPDADLPMHALLDILSHYQNDDEEIASFVKQRLYPRLLQESNLDIPTLPPHVLGGLLHYLAHSAPLDEFHADTYYLAIATAIESEDDQLVGLAERLEERYLDTLQDEDEEDGLLNTLEDCFDIDDIMIIRDGNQALVTFKEDVFPSLTTPGTPPILTRAATLSFDPESGWGFTPTITNMQERLRLSPLLRHTYTSQSMSAFRTSLMQTCFAKLDEDHKRQGDLDLSDLHTTLRERCEQAFQMSGIRDPRSKIIDPCSKEYQYLMALQDMMIATQSKTDVLLSPHAIDKLNKLFTSVGLHGKHAGMGFLLLGLMLTKLTSSYFWGTEGESPGPLRVIACACVSEAAKKGIISQEKFLDIKRRLQGEGNAFTCTAVVADKLQREAKDQFSTHRGYDHFYDTAKGMLPVAWGMSV